VRAGPKDCDIKISVCLFRSRAHMTSAAETFWSAIEKRWQARTFPSRRRARAPPPESFGAREAHHHTSRRSDHL